MERTIRFAAADWLEGGKPNRDKLATALGTAAAKVLSAQLASSSWSDVTGKLTLLLKRPSDMFTDLALTETIELNAMIAPDQPGAFEHLMLWVSAPSITTTDELSPPKLNLIDSNTDDDEGDQNDEYGIVDALAKEFKAQRWDIENTVWK